MTRALVVAPDLASVVETLAAESARVLGADTRRARSRRDAHRHAGALPVMLDGVRLGELVISDGPAVVDTRVAERVATQLAGLIALGEQRDRLLAERVEATSLRHSDEVKTALLRAVSHDLRSPLMAISAAAGTLRMTATDPVERELTDTVLSETERMSRLVSDLLDLSRLQAGAFERREDWCDVGDLVRAAVRETGRSGPAAVVSDAVGAPAAGARRRAPARAGPRQPDRERREVLRRRQPVEVDAPHERRPGRGVGARSRAGHRAGRAGSGSSSRSTAERRRRHPGLGARTGDRPRARRGERRRRPDRAAPGRRRRCSRCRCQRARRRMSDARWCASGPGRRRRAADPARARADADAGRLRRADRGDGPRRARGGGA